MSIGRSFQESVQKALRSLETGLTGFDEVDIPGFAAADSDDGRRQAGWAEALAATGSEPEATWVFQDVAVLAPDREEILEHRSVVVRDEVITEVGPASSVTVPRGARVISGQGRFLMPGLAEMHAHVPPVPDPDRELLEDYMFLYVANGVTTIRGMLGQAYQIELADELERNELLGPTFYVGAPSINGTSAPDPATAERLIRTHAEAGYDLQKIHPGVSRESWDRMVEAAREVGLTFGGHVPTDVGLEHALETGMSTVDHLDGYVRAVAGDAVQSQVNAGAIDLEALEDPEAYAAAIDAMVELSLDTDVYVVPTMYLWENLYRGEDPDRFLDLPEMRYVSARQREAWRRQGSSRGPRGSQEGLAAFFALRNVILERLADAGAGILMGTDSPQLYNVPGFALHREIEYMERAGMTRWQILRSGTTEVASYVEDHLGLAGNFGTVEAGNRADLVLLEENPLEDLGHLTSRVGVMVRGRWVPAAEIREGLERLAAKHAGVS